MSEGEGRTCISIMDAGLEASDESQERTKEDTEFKSERCTAVRIVGAWRGFALAPPGRSRYDWLRQADTGPMPRIDDADNRFASRKSNASGKSGPFPFRTLVRGACKCTSPLIFRNGPDQSLPVESPERLFCRPAPLRHPTGPETARMPDNNKNNPSSRRPTAFREDSAWEGCDA